MCFYVCFSLILRGDSTRENVGRQEKMLSKNARSGARTSRMECQNRKSHQNNMQFQSFNSESFRECSSDL